MIRNKIVNDDIIVRKSILHILNSGSGQIGLATNLKVLVTPPVVTRIDPNPKIRPMKL